MAKFRKRPVLVEAITFDELFDISRKKGVVYKNGDAVPISFEYAGQEIVCFSATRYLIPTLEGTMDFNRGEMLITGVNGEIYPCKMDIFEKTYDKYEPKWVDGDELRSHPFESANY